MNNIDIFFFLSLLSRSSFLSVTGLLRLQQIYQNIVPGNESFRVDIVKRITNVAEALEFLRTIEDLNRWTYKYIVLDCSTTLAKQIVVSHVRDVKLGKRTYHYLLSGLVSKHSYNAHNFR